MCQGCALASQDFGCDLRPQPKSWQNIKLFLFSVCFSFACSNKKVLLSFKWILKGNLGCQQKHNDFINVPGLRPGKPRFCLRPSATSKILVKHEAFSLFVLF
jgi:hypothetical protein